MDLFDFVGIGLIVIGLAIAVQCREIGRGMNDEMPRFMLVPFHGERAQTRYWLGFGIVVIFLGVGAILNT